MKTEAKAKTMKSLQDYQAVSNQLKEANNEKTKIKKEGDSNVDKFLKEKKDLVEEKNKI
tara:strand:+ start:863 stop:1039 length:177 start_codon:yes stop_codon:yes gene_type:complete